jgi:hypothetical protein
MVAISFQPQSAIAFATPVSAVALFPQFRLIIPSLVVRLLLK